MEYGKKNNNKLNKWSKGPIIKFENLFKLDTKMQI